MTLDVHVVAESDNDLLNLLSKLTGRCEDESLSGLYREVEFLEDRDGKGCSLSGTGLGLSDDIVTLDDRDNRTLLDGGRTLETVSVDTAEKLWLDIHVVKVIDHFIPVGLNFAVGDILKRFLGRHDCMCSRRKRVDFV